MNIISISKFLQRFKKACAVLAFIKSTDFRIKNEWSDLSSLVICIKLYFLSFWYYELRSFIEFRSNQVDVSLCFLVFAVIII